MNELCWCAKKKVFGPSVDVFPTLREGIDLRGAQETPRAARREPLFSGRNQQQTRVVVQQIFGGNSATTARILLLLLFCLTSKAKEAAVQHVLRAAVSYRLGAPARPPAQRHHPPTKKRGSSLLSWDLLARAFKIFRKKVRIHDWDQNAEYMCRMCDVLYVAGWEPIIDFKMLPP